MRVILGSMVLVSLACSSLAEDQQRVEHEAAFLTQRGITFFYHYDTNLCFAQYGNSITNVACTPEVIKVCLNHPDN